MTLEQFDEYFEILVVALRTLASSKGKEYANSKDRFANFRRLAAELDLKDYQVGWVYCKKHLDAIASYMKNGETYSNEPIQGRFEDAILYLLLIAGMVEEERNPELLKTWFPATPTMPNEESDIPF